MRYAIEIISFSINNDETKSANYQLSKSIDDEHSPGIFEIFATTIKQTQPSQLSPCQTFISWKPAAYTDKDPGFDNKALAYSDQYTGENQQLPKKGGSLPILDESAQPWTIAFHQKINYFGVNMTFGQNKDGGYMKTKYVQWYAYFLFPAVKLNNK